MIQVDEAELTRQTAERLANKLAASRDFWRHIALCAWDVMPQREGVRERLQAALDLAVKEAEEHLKSSVRHQAEELANKLRERGWSLMMSQETAIREHLDDAVKTCKIRLRVVMRGAVKDLIGDRADALLGRIFAKLEEPGERVGAAGAETEEREEDT